MHTDRYCTYVSLRWCLACRDPPRYRLLASNSLRILNCAQLSVLQRSHQLLTSRGSLSRPSPPKQQASRSEAPQTVMKGNMSRQVTTTSVVHLTVGRWLICYCYINQVETTITHQSSFRLITLELGLVILAPYFFLQGQHDSLPGHNNRFEDRQNATANAPITHRPSWSSSAPSAGWSTSSPTAWGASQTGSSAQTWAADQGSSGQSLVQKAKEYLPGGTGTHASESTTDSSDPTLLEKAKQYLPGSNNSQPSEQSSGGQMQGTTETQMVSSLGNMESAAVVPPPHYMCRLPV